MKPNPESESESENLLEKAEAELDRRLEAGELDEEEFSFAYQRMEETTPVSGGEIAKQNGYMLKRRDSFRRVAEMLGVGFGKLPFVQKVVLFGSVAAPLKKEVPRFRRMRRARVEIYHECNDVDLGGWTKYSECVRATATNLLAPYTFQEVVLQKRSNHWDNSRVHNVKIIQADGKFLLFYINSANQTGYAVADAVTGPWTRPESPALHASNPAPIARPDGSLYVFCRLRDSASVNRGVAFTAPGCQGPWSPVANGDNLLPENCELEDPTIWWANHQYNLLVNDWKGRATGTVKAGAQYFSKDGVHYQFMTREPIFTKTVLYDDGTSETFSRRERPFVYADEHGAILALFTACLPKEGASRIVVQPVKNYLPGN